MALTVYYEGLEKKINTTLILSSENNLQSDGCFYIEIHWSGFFIEQEHFDIFAPVPLEVDSNIGSETYGDVV
jgi:hypothetical protein